MHHPWIDRVIRVSRWRKADALRQAYAKYGDRVEIVVVNDLVKGDFTDALKGVSAVIHTATPVPGREELQDILKVSRPSLGGLIPSSHRLFPDHQGGSSEHCPPGCDFRCQTYLLRWNCCRSRGFYRPSDSSTFIRRDLESLAREESFGIE